MMKRSIIKELCDVQEIVCSLYISGYADLAINKLSVVTKNNSSKRTAACSWGETQWATGRWNALL